MCKGAVTDFCSVRAGSSLLHVSHVLWCLSLDLPRQHFFKVPTVAPKEAAPASSLHRNQVQAELSRLLSATLKGIDLADLCPKVSGQYYDLGSGAQLLAFHLGPKCCTPGGGSGLPPNTLHPACRSCNASPTLRCPTATLCPHLLFQPPFLSPVWDPRIDQEQRLLAAGRLKAHNRSAPQRPAHLLSLWGRGIPRTMVREGLSLGSPASRTAPPAPSPQPRFLPRPRPRTLPVVKDRPAPQRAQVSSAARAAPTQQLGIAVTLGLLCGCGWRSWVKTRSPAPIEPPPRLSPAPRS